MIDLTEVPLEDLKAELGRRANIRRIERDAEKKIKVCCENCAYRIYGRTHAGRLEYETWVCEARPKNKQFGYAGNILPYNTVFYCCDAHYNNVCELFVHKESEEGKKIVKKRRKMVGVVSDVE